MSLWLILLIVAVVFLVLEMFTPTLFFINLAIAAAVSSAFAYLGYSSTVITFVFLIVSIASIGLIRPFLLKKFNENSKAYATGLEDKYIGKVAKVIQDVSKDGGRVSIYGEEWQAKLSENSQDDIAVVGDSVKIISNESIIFTVEKIKEN